MPEPRQKKRKHHYPIGNKGVVSPILIALLR